MSSGVRRAWCVGDVTCCRRCCVFNWMTFCESSWCYTSEIFCQILKIWSKSCLGWDLTFVLVIDDQDYGRFSFLHNLFFKFGGFFFFVGVWSRSASELERAFVCFFLWGGLVSLGKRARVFSLWGFGLARQASSSVHSLASELEKNDP